MTDYSIEQTTQWVHEYWVGYCRYMEEFYPVQFFKFRMKITGRFCREYDNPIDFPEKFEKLPDE